MFCTTGAIHMATRTATPRPAARGADHRRAEVTRLTPDRRSRTPATTPAPTDTSRSTTTRGAAEKSVCTTREPTSTAPRADSGDGVVVAAHRTAKSKRGTMITVAVHGDTAAPRAPSE